ncbi:hypothetical protein [Leadbettera azotonutricia]|uniref:Uncharacterized protein n=1 Tax=Leadbettera azotonutricia (strain ATCC BAA-888 / DSM 13862 / ZAS-9) TaxID=545695 RepID=F5YBI4_LEAAZ|nr:hypothetical protein [Leadbettera azotonutricia]AEF80190.1 hypothetical protein TREAZ_0599 [Leadbettera azotonutricia ZAS-9]
MKEEVKAANPVEEIKAEIKALEKEIKKHREDNIGYMSMKPEKTESTREELRLERLAASRIELLKKQRDKLTQEEKKPEIDRRLSLVRKAAEDLSLLAQSEADKIIKAMEKIENAREEFNLYSDGLGCETFLDVFSGINGIGHFFGDVLKGLKETTPLELPGFPEKVVLSSRSRLDILGLPEIRTPEQVKQDNAEWRKRYKNIMSRNN